MQISLKNLLNIILIISVIVTFFLGFFLDEDSAGGGKIDLIEHEWGNLTLFKETPLIEALTSMSYESSRTPLFLIIHKYNFFIEDILDFRVITLTFGILIFIFYIVCLKKIFKYKENNLIILVASLILLSPYFRSSVFWANQEHLSIFFLVISLIFLHSSLDKNNKLEESYKEYYFFPILSSLFAFLSFYSDQKLFFIAAIVYFLLIYKKPVYFFFIFSLINFLFFIPAIYLFKLWGNIVPIESQLRLVNTPSNINIFISNIGIYFIPFAVFLCLQKNFKLFVINKIESLILILISFFLFLTLPIQPFAEGGGIVFRLLSIFYLKNLLAFEWPTFQILYLICNIIFFYLIIIFLRFSLKNIFIILSLASIYYMTSFTYQSYVDPIFLILIYTLFDLRNINLWDSKLIYLNFIFYSLILANSILFRLFII